MKNLMTSDYLIALHEPEKNDVILERLILYFCIIYRGNRAKLSKIRSSFLPFQNKLQDCASHSYNSPFE